jgi:hypothetical protein
MKVLLTKYIMDFENGNDKEVESAGWGGKERCSDKLIQLQQKDGSDGICR